MLKKAFVLITTVFAAGYAFAETSPEDAALPHNGETGVRITSPYGETVEQFQPDDRAYNEWSKTFEDDAAGGGDKVETRKVLDKDVKTRKLKNVVPPIYFESGEADIPEEYVGKLRAVLEDMKDRANVRLHFVGHTDDVKLRGALLERYGDNEELSRERAGTTAEFFQRALDLPPESISYEGVGDTMPLADNDTAAGRAQNRRVEVEVWYDEINEKLVEKEFVVSEEMKRVKVCRVETVCKLRYKEGHAKRARVKNLVAPLRYTAEKVEIPAVFLEQLQEALKNLRTKENVVVKFIGHTDNVPLVGRDARIYGNHLGLSKARARRAALAVQEQLNLPSSAIDSDGKGAKDPVASNETEKGRMLNRRIEVEFWYDDALQELPDEPQLCPEASAAETVTRVYDPPSGAIEPIIFNSSNPVIPPGYSQRLRRLMEELDDKTNVRLRFVGYISNERLSRRTAAVYGDDIGLSTARARRVMERIRDDVELTDEQFEVEGRGYVQSDDVVNAGFVESEQSRVVVQVVYDELALLDDREGMDITRITREVETQSPYALNLMRITVDGQPVNDPGKSIPDVQRCTDVALEQADIKFKFDNLDFKPRLNVTAWPATVRYQDDKNTAEQENLVRFRAYTNYSNFIDKAEVRIFDDEQSLRDEPLIVVPVGDDGYAQWQADFDEYEAPGRTLKYVLRVTDSEGRFDETQEQKLWLVDSLDVESLSTADPESELLVGYGENRLVRQNIPLNGGTIKVYGSEIPEGHTVWLAGRSVPIGKGGEFVAEELLPSGLHTVEVAVLDDQGNGELFLRDLELEKSDWFYVGIVDVTASEDDTNGPAVLVTQDEAHYDNDLSVDGRLAFYVNGKFGEDWELTASADSREGPVDEIFSNFMEKSPDAMFRRIDPDYYYPSYGDDSTVEEDAPTLGKFYAKLERRDNYGMWGNFKIGYTGNTLAHVDRTLYGANVHLQSSDATTFGEARYLFDTFAAEPGTVGSREEFRGTGGSLYYLSHQDILSGSERLRIEIRDKDSNMVIGVKNLTPGLDYDVDYLQGRILLTEPLSATAGDNMLVDSGGSSGDRVYLVARYEYTPGFDDIDTLAVGGRAHYWFGDYVKLGVTANRNDEDDDESSLSAADITLRKSANTWVKLESSQTEGAGTDTFYSIDGGYTFGGDNSSIGNEDKASAYRVDSSVALSDLFAGMPGKITLYNQELEGGYSAPGLIALTDTSQYGGTLTVPVNERIGLRAKSDKKTQQDGLETTATELDVDYKLDRNWTISSGVRADERKDNSEVVAATQEEGERTDMRLQAAYDSKEDWTAYGFVQDTLDTTGNRDENGRLGTGGSYRISDRFKLNGEVSQGDIGAAGMLGAEYLYSDRTSLYMNYALENERSDNGVRAQKGNMSTGFRTHYSDSASVYMEERYTHGDVPTGLTHSAGVDLAPNDRWNYGVNADFGTLKDPQTSAETERTALGARLGYNFDGVTLASALEYRVDKNENPADASVSERTTWLTKNSLKYQLTPDWRLLSKFNHSESESTLGEFYDGNYTEAVLGYAFRPISHDRLNTLFKYTYFYNLPAVDQVTMNNTAAEYIQKSHILSADVSYDLSSRWTVGAKYAYRRGQISQDRTDPEFFDSDAYLYVLRADWHFLHRWDALVEARMLEVPQAEDRRSGSLVGLYRHIGKNVKLGLGYNFTDFSDDLTDLDYDSEGYFINLIGKI
ncbi:MAG: OmpA family protein [Pseudomonadota bacterium]